MAGSIIYCDTILGKLPDLFSLSLLISLNWADTPFVAGGLGVHANLELQSDPQQAVLWCLLFMHVGIIIKLTAPAF